MPDRHEVDSANSSHPCRPRCYVAAPVSLCVLTGVDSSFCSFSILEVLPLLLAEVAIRFAYVLALKYLISLPPPFLIVHPWESIAHHPWKSMLTVLLCSVLVCFAGLFVGDGS